VLFRSSDDEAIDSIQKLTGYKIPVHGGEATANPAAPSAPPAPSETDEKPRRARSERGGRGRGAAKTDKVAVPPVEEPKAAPAKAPKPRDDRKPAAAPKPTPAPRRDDQDGPDDGWNGPMPGFLSVGFGS